MYPFISGRPSQKYVLGRPLPGERFKAIVKLIATGSETQITLDLGQTKMIDSAGIGMLLLANDKAVKESKKMSLTGVNGHVAKVIELSKVDQIIPIA